MAFDSETICARTAAGEAELAKPSQGLSLGQRRVLGLLQDPSAVEELAQRHHLDPDKLARDLTRLSELRLVLLQGPTIAAIAPASPVAAVSMAPVILGHPTRRSPAVALGAGAALLALAAGIWYATRAHETPKANPPALPAPVEQKVAALPPPPPASPARVTNEPAPAVAVVLRGNTTPVDFRPEARPGLVPAVASTTSALPAPKIPEPKTTPAPEAVPRSATSPAPVTPAPAVVAAVPAPVNVAPAAAATPEPTPPVQLAAVAPAPAPRPAVAAELKAISRDAPDFPREAIAAGVKGGVVTARIHVEANGKVSAVDILAGQPPRVFDRVVRNTLSRWQFEPMATGRTSDVEINFQRE